MYQVRIVCTDSYTGEESCEDTTLQDLTAAELERFYKATVEDSLIEVIFFQQIGNSVAFVAKWTSDFDRQSYSIVGHIYNQFI